MNKNIILIGFHNEKALGVRYLYRALSQAGFTPHIIYFKAFNSQIPQQATGVELDLLKRLVKDIDPLFVGLSVMSSLYLETADKVTTALRESFPDLTLVWGGVFPTLEPERALAYCDIVLRGEGEDAIVETAEALNGGGSVENIENVAYINKDGICVKNDLRCIADIDRFGYPPIGGDNIYLINNNQCAKGDPQLRSFTYELCASRGCPYTCSYCSSINLRRLYQGKGRYVRFRSVDSVIEELAEAKRLIPKLSVVHFWDEIFSDAPGWVEEFAARYKSEIGIPFRVWGHPLRSPERIISNLVDAGLHQIVVGVQSGSPVIRKDIFNRHETQEQIIECSRVLARCGVPRVYYDLMICHPFESTQQLRETFEMCTELEPPFLLNIHGLNFLPATDIVQMALDQGKFTQEEMDSMMYSSLQTQYDQHWGPNAKSFQRASGGSVWVGLIRLTQYRKIRKRVLELAGRAGSGEDVSGEVFALESKMERRQKLRDLADKARLVLKI